jgi:hypothetical protein
VLQDAVELGVSVGEDYSAGRALQGLHQVLGIYCFLRGVLRDLCPDLLRSLAASEAYEHGVLAFGDHVLHRVQVHF